MSPIGATTFRCIFSDSILNQIGYDRNLHGMCASTIPLNLCRTDVWKGIRKASIILAQGFSREKRISERQRIGFMG